jgi:hypothetical protein
MQSSTSTPRFPQAGWLGAKMVSWISKKPRRASPAKKQLASQQDLERLRQKFTKQPSH